MKRLPGVLAEIAERMGPQVAERLGREFGGQQLYIPTLGAQTRRERDARIKLESNAGVGIDQLARRHGLSRRQVYNIVGRKNC